MFKASVGIFQKSSTDTKRNSTPLIPKEVFEAADRVVKNKNEEMVKTSIGYFYVKYSETGPFQTYMGNEWLPVYVAHFTSWNSGGIKTQEYIEYENTNSESSGTSTE